jgi:hypothetical protein
VHDQQKLVLAGEMLRLAEDTTTMMVKHPKLRLVCPWHLEYLVCRHSSVYA